MEALQRRIKAVGSELDSVIEKNKNPQPQVYENKVFMIPNHRRF